MVIFLTFGALKNIKILNHQKVDMKKIILSVAIASLAISCKKVPAGGNKGVLIRDSEVERYSDDVMTDTTAAEVEAAHAKKNSTVETEDNAKVSAQPAIAIQKDSIQNTNMAAPASAEKK
ncbi:hypothetical protein [Kaistella sp.]|uniref:hypothetical protein n=1 Tax=Kaistella sp. TaxID=2782235 RepID=UPI003C4BC511